MGKEGRAIEEGGTNVARGKAVTFVMVCFVNFFCVKCTHDPEGGLVNCQLFRLLMVQFLPFCCDLLRLQNHPAVWIKFYKMKAKLEIGQT